MGAQKYDPEIVLEDAKRVAPQCVSLADVARRLRIDRRTLGSILDSRVDTGPHETLFQALLAISDASSIDVSESAVFEQLRYWRAKAKEAEKQLGQREWFVDTLREVVSVLSTEPVEFPEPYEIPSGKSEHVAMLLLSDLHYGLKTYNLGVFPEYNSEVAQHAIKEIFVRTLSLIEKNTRGYMDIQHMVINLAGDLVEHNFLRKGHRGEVDRHVVKQVSELARLLAEGIKVFARAFPKVYVTGIPGNHGRADPIPGAGDPTESFDWLTFDFLSELLSNQGNIECYFPECWYSLVRVFDHLSFTMHGEDIRSWAGIPWYGLSRAIKDVLMMLTHITKRDLANLDKEMTLKLEEFLEILKIPDTVLIGHFHTAIDWDEIGVNAICNGSLVGATRYSLKNRRRLSRPCQKLLFFHPEWGLVDDRKVFLHDIVEQLSPRESDLPEVLQVG